MNLDTDHWESDYRTAGRRSLEAILEGRMQERITYYLDEMARLGEADRRNGYFSRHLLTELGGIELTIPRTRRFSPVSIVRAYARRAAHIDRMILACFVLGISTRKVSQALLPVLGEPVGATTVSRVAQSLDTAVRAFARRWSHVYPKAVACLGADEEQLLTFLQIKDASWWSQIRTTNAIVRRFREVRRHTRPMGVFSDRTSMERILYAVFSCENLRQGVATPFLAVTQNS